MWSRIALKNNAKRILRGNYWWIVLVSLILGIAAGEGISVNFNLDSSGISTNMRADYYSSGSYFDEIMGNTYDYDSDLYGFGSDTYISDVLSSLEILFTRMFGELSAIGWSLIFGVLSFVLVISVLIQCFLLAPLEVGCKRWFLKNRTQKPEAGEMAYAFKNGYLNVVKTMFCMNLFTALWSLLFIIPGIIKAYEYRMIPYLLAENPNMDMHEAFARSRAMMTGNKWEAFVLDLSFLGWRILAAFTCGVLNVLYVSPYVHLTDTELYVELCSSGNENGEQYRYEY